MPVRHPRVVELAPEQLLVSFWAYVPALERRPAPILAQFISSVGPLAVSRLMEPIRLIVTSGFSEPVLSKQLPEHHLKAQLAALERRVQDMDEERMLGLY